jgi:threonine aldolase
MFKAEVMTYINRTQRFIELEAKAAMFGMEAGLFFPSGTANKQP